MRPNRRWSASSSSTDAATAIDFASGFARVMMAPPQLVALARKAAAAQSLDPALVCAIVEQESSWNTWAMRYEPAFFAKYVAGLYTNNKITASEAYARGFSWGLMQVMGQVALRHGLRRHISLRALRPRFGPDHRLSAVAKKVRCHGRRRDSRPPGLEWRSKSSLPSPSPRPPRTLFVIAVECGSPAAAFPPQPSAHADASLEPQAVRAIGGVTCRNRSLQTAQVFVCPRACVNPSQARHL